MKKTNLILVAVAIFALVFSTVACRFSISFTKYEEGQVLKALNSNTAIYLGVPTGNPTVDQISCMSFINLHYKITSVYSEGGTNFYFVETTDGPLSCMGYLSGGDITGNFSVSE